MYSHKSENGDHMNKQSISEAMGGRPRLMPVRKNSLVTYIAMFFWWLSGWRTVGSLPNEKKMLVAAAPHTSNWDFIVGLPIILALGIKGTIMMKKEAFIWPFSYLWRWIGFIPTERHSSSGAVGSVVEHFNNSQTMWFVLSPEGTRSKIKQWRSGFLHIAHQANVPILLVSWDFPTKTVHFGRVMHTSGDYEKDMQNVREYFSQFTGKRPENH